MLHVFARLNGRFRKPPQGGREGTDEYSHMQYRNTGPGLEHFAPWQDVAGKSVLELGCGLGGRAAALKREFGAARVTAVDIDAWLTEHARSWCRRQGVEVQCLVGDAIRLPFRPESFDVIQMSDSFEHIHQPERILPALAPLLKPGGLIHINTIGWYAAYGSHLYDYVWIPWAHLLFPERLLLAHWQSEFERDLAAGRMSVFNAQQQRDARSVDELVGVNRLSLRTFERCLAGSGLEVLSYKVSPGRRLLRVPLLRELFANRIYAVLRRKEIE